MAILAKADAGLYIPAQLTPVFRSIDPHVDKSDH